MQDLHEKLDLLDHNVKALVRKLKETLQNNEILQNENNKLKQEIEEFEIGSRAKDIDKMNSKSPSDISGEKYQKIKSEIKSCISEIDECIGMMEK